MRRKTAETPPQFTGSLAFLPRATGSVEQRLARTERELVVQFTRIAQLQAEVDQLVAALRSREPVMNGNNKAVGRRET